MIKIFGIIIIAALISTVITRQNRDAIIATLNVIETKFIIFAAIV